MRLRRFTTLGLGLLLLVSLSQAHAFLGLCCAKCGGNMPMNIPGGGIPETKEFRVKLSPMFMSMDGLLNGGDTVAASDLLGMPVMMGNPTGKFMAVPTSMDMRMTNLAVGYSFTDTLFGAVMFMHKDNDMNMRFNSMMTSMTRQNDFTMKSSGLADTMLMGKYRLFTNDPLVPTRQASLLFGLNLPTGSIDERNRNHPLAMRQTELQPYGMQLGSGTFDPTIGLLYQGSSSPYWWGANAQSTLRLYDNDRDYRLGNEVRLDLYGMHQFRANLLAQVQLNGRAWGKIKGEANESATGLSGHVTKNDPTSPYMSPLWDPQNYGGRKVLATIGLQWQPVPLQIVDLTLGVPIHQHLNGPQLEEDYRVMLTWYLEIPTKGSVRHFGSKAGNSKLGF